MESTNKTLEELNSEIDCIRIQSSKIHDKMNECELVLMYLKYSASPTEANDIKAFDKLTLYKASLNTRWDELNATSTTLYRAMLLKQLHGFNYDF